MIWDKNIFNFTLILVVATLCSLIIVAILLVRRVLQHAYPSLQRGKKGLYRQLGLMFIIAGFVPTILVSGFSIYLFNVGIHPWFDKRISNVLEQSLYVANAYLKENQEVLKSVAVSMASDLGAVYSKVLERPMLLSEVLEAQADLHNLSEAVIFQGLERKIMVQSTLSLLLFVSEITDSNLHEAAEGNAVFIASGPDKIQYLVKLPEYSDSYLLVSRLVDQNVVQHVDKTYGALGNYNSFKESIHLLQLEFSLVFLLVSLLLLVVSIYAGLVIADRFVKPLARLVAATAKIKEGNLDVQVDQYPDPVAEVEELINAFNMMIKKIKYQQQDLIMAQQALAWSDVARRVAHEIKNPLTSISLSSERVITKFSNQTSDNTSFLGYMNNILKFCNSINTILTEFVNFARLPEPVFQPLDFVALIHEVVHSRKIIHENIQYKFVDSPDSLKFMGDKRQLNQMLVNIVKNAEESITESATKDKQIHIYLSEQASALVLKVVDSGPGFKAVSIDRVSEAYFTTRGKGSGLGLAIVKKIVQDHYGMMSVVNAESGGGEVTIRFNTKKQNY